MRGEIFIALFRGLNVGGQHRVKMADLKALFEELGFQEVWTSVQSGNVVARAGVRSPPIMAQDIERCFEKRFGFAARVILRSLAEWMELIESNPFPDVASDGTKLHGYMSSYWTIMLTRPHPRLLPARMPRTAICAAALSSTYTRPTVSAAPS
jgi:uncharacterized protein (DUF1697 family)